MKSAKWIGAVLACVCLAQGAIADVTVTLLGDPVVGLKGAAFERDPKTKQPYTRLDIMNKTRVSVVVPGNKTIVVASSGRTTIQSEGGWINQVSCGAGYDGLPAKDAIAYIDNFLSANKLTLDEQDQKSLAEFKASPTSKSFSATVRVPDWTVIYLRCSSGAGKLSPEINIYGDPEGTQGDVLPAGAIKLPIGPCAFAPDGSWITDGKQVFDMTGKQLAKVPVTNVNQYSPPRVSSDGKLVALGTDEGKLVIVNPSDWSVKNTFDIADMPAGQKVVVLVGLSPSGDLAYVIGGKVLRAVSTADGSEKLRFDPLPAEIAMRSGAISHNGATIAIGMQHGQTIHLFDTATGKAKGTLEPKKLPSDVTIQSLTDASKLQFLQGDHRLASSGFMGSKHPIWSLDSNEIERVCESQSTQGLAFSEDGKYYVAASWHTMWGPNAICLHDAAKGTLIGAARPLKGVMSGATFSPDGKYVVAWRNQMSESLLLKTADLLAAKPGPYKKPAAPVAK